MIVIGIILIVVSILGNMERTVYDERREIPIPPMGTATGWAPLPMPDVMGIADVKVVVEWDDATHWVGVTSKEEAVRCEPDSATKISVKCNGDDIEFEVGGPSDTVTSLEWEVESGIWYVCLGQNSGQISGDSTLSADIVATASITTSAMLALLSIGSCMIVGGLLLGRK